MPVSKKESTRRNGTVLFSFEINGGENVSAVIEQYRINPAMRSIDLELVANNSLGSFAAGVFLACGSVNDPSKEYHLEFAVPEEKLADDLMILPEHIGITPKKAVRRNQYIIYIKDSESIEDTLTFIGAQQCTLELMNVKIYKDVRNKANRITNCDSANIDKVVNAAIKQTDDIQLIERTTGLDSLPEELRQVALLRLSEKEMSLRDMGALLSPPISRSGVNHRLKKIARIADEIRCGSMKANERK